MTAVKLKKPASSSCCCGQDQSSCCAPHRDQIQMRYSPDAPWVTGSITTTAGPVQQISTQLTFSDMMGSVKVRIGVNRYNYKVEPGIYCVGTPDGSSPVLVTANYKMTFDCVRRELDGLNAWILVLDTKGINVWCAAGKGTFGTTELVQRIAKVQLVSIVEHQNIILPQLGASGVSAHETLKQSGFRVIYGPVRASDIKAFLENGMTADPEMREVRFTFLDRLALTPLELVHSVKPLLITLGIFFLSNSLGIGNFNITDLIAILGSIIVGTFLVPALLPFIPGRAFSFKGWLTGILWVLLLLYLSGFPAAPAPGWFRAAAYLLVLPAVSSYLAMDFTGCSTYTSFSGVKREMQIALPLQIISAGLGLISLLVDIIISLVK